MNTKAIFGETGWLGRAMTSSVAIGVLATSRPSEQWVWAVLGAGLLTFLAGTALMTLRPTWAVGLLAYAAISSAFVTGVPKSNALVVVLIAITDIAVMAHPWRNRPIIVVGVACTFAYALSGWHWDRPASWFFTELMWTGILVAFGLNRRQYEVQARQTAQLLEQTQLAQQEHARAAALDERGRIARELHDVLAHSLGALSVQLEVAEGLLADRNDTAGALDRVRRSRKLAVQGLVEARSAVAALRTDEVPALPEALAAMAEQHEKDHQTEVTMTNSGTPRPIASGITVALLGAAREALTNAGKHASGQAVEVRLDYRKGVRLMVRTPGTTDSIGQGFGLTGMRERLALVGGKLEAGPDGDGWLVVAEVADA
ncbi:histidine kinase [Kribbella sp. NPDC056861]|uniref:sensor histidine kinase n=1 Tax=Kribbella sp. NPDC056861 TaxID=3154857 RepID=UPI003428F111